MVEFDGERMVSMPPSPEEIGGLQLTTQEDWSILKENARAKAREPKIPSGSILVRLHPEERTTIKEAAAKADLSLNAFCRRVLLAASKLTLEQPDGDR